MTIRKDLKKILTFFITLILGFCLLSDILVVKAYEGDTRTVGLNEELIETDINKSSRGSLDTEAAIWEVLDLVNSERAAAGLSPLVMDTRLVNTANIRAQEIVTSFSHTRPNGTSCFTAYSNDVTWWAKGENIAAGYGSASEVMNGWMNSSGHRANILSSNFNCIGISCYYVPGSAYGYYWVQNFGYTSSPSKMSKGGTFESTGIYVVNSDRNGVTAGLTVNNPDNDTLQYSWYASKDDGATWTLIQDWTTGNEWFSWKPGVYGEYILLGKARKAYSTNEVVQSVTNFSYHPYIKGKCQMPYDGPGGGYLIGVESYENPNQSYQYEMLILDCTKLAAGEPPWVYTTGKRKAPEGCAAWTIWQPQYGYYWTLFRVFDANGNLLDESCYGFVNAY